MDIGVKILAENSTDDADEKHWYYAGAKFTEAPFTPYATAIGQGTLAWNSLQESLGGVFWGLMGGYTGVGRPIAVWQSLKADRPKRDMLQAAYKGLDKSFDELFPQARADLDWLVKEINSLEDARNNFVHAPLSMTVPVSAFKTLGPTTSGKQRREIPKEAKVVPHDWGMNTRAQRIAGKNLLKEFRYCREAAIVLRDFCDHVTHALRTKGAPWPDRPKLPNRGQKKTK